jgi:hypothetical protein
MPPPRLTVQAIDTMPLRARGSSLVTELKKQQQRRLQERQWEEEYIRSPGGKCPEWCAEIALTCAHLPQMLSSRDPSSGNMTKVSGSLHLKGVNSRLHGGQIPLSEGSRTGIFDPHQV